MLPYNVNIILTHKPGDDIVSSSNYSKDEPDV